MRIGCRGVVLTLLVAGCAGKPAAPTTAEVQVTEDGFVPAQVALARGKPVTLVITRTTDATCATSAVFAAPDGRRFKLPLGQPVRIELPATRPDTLRYSCSMGMYDAAVVSR